MMAGQHGARYKFTGVTFIDKGIEHVANLFDSTPSLCKMPGCNQQCYVENNGRTHDFCGKTHARQFKAMQEAEREKIMREKLLQAHRAQNSGGAGWRSSPSGYVVVNSVGACHGSWSPGPSHTRSGATYGVHVAHSHPTVGNQPGSGPIRFYNKDDPYYEFTNFYPAPIDLDGKMWPTTEHYFQAQKFIGTSFTEVIRNFQRPREAFDLSRNPAVSRWRRNDWEDVKINVMRKALLAKFTQHRNLRQMLLKTGDSMLIEHSPYDNFWGNGGDDTGENHLGMLLMEIRYDLNMIQESLKREEILQPVRLSPDAHRKGLLQKHESTEKDSSSSESSMDYTNTEASDTNQSQQNNPSNNQNQDLNALTRPPLHSNHVVGSSQSAVEAGLPQGEPDSSTGTGPAQSGEPPVADLINFDDPEPPMEDKHNPLMVDNRPQDLARPLLPTPTNQCGMDTSTVNFRKEQPSSNNGNEQQEDMDTSSSNNTH